MINIPDVHVLIALSWRNHMYHNVAVCLLPKRVL